jgi:ribosomal protein S18 acetylase RimI-like enzyme
VLLADIRFCTKDNLTQILEVDRTSLYPWPERLIRRDFLVGDAQLSYLGAFAPVVEDKLLGYAVLGDEKGKGLLMNLVVLPEYRRRGIGAQLVTAVAECAVDLGFSVLALRVRVSNFAALSLYRELGFKVDGTRKGFYSDGDVAQYMSVKLPLSF